jgi:predicted outer membrane repeat protein
MLIGRLPKITLGLVLATSFCAGAAKASLFIVNDQIDEKDANVADGICSSTPSAKCTLRAAVEQANALRGTDQISLPLGTYRFTVLEPGFNDVDGLQVLDYTDIQGTGQSLVFLDGGKLVPLVRTLSVAALIVDNTFQRVNHTPWNGLANSTFTSGATFNNMMKAVIAPEGLDHDLLVTTLDDGVQRYSGSSGAFVGTLISPMVNGTPLAGSDIVFGPPGSPVADNILVSNFLPGGGVYRFSETGAPLGTLVAPAGTSGFGAMELAFLSGANNLLVLIPTEHRIARYDLNGAFLGNLVTGIPGLIRDMTIRNTEIYVAIEDAGVILRYDLTTGQALGVFAGGSTTPMTQPQFLEFAPDGELFVYSHGSDEIQRYDGRTGQFAGVYAAGGSPGLGSVGAFVLRFERQSGPLVNISNLTLMNGGSRFGGDFNGGLYGGAGSFVTARNVTVRDCKSSTFGGGIGNWGQMVLDRVTVTGNSLNPPGAGGQTSQGGGIFNTGSLFVTDSLIANNYAGRGGGVSTQTFPGEPGARTDLVNTTVSGNQSEGEGGGIRATNIDPVTPGQETSVNLNFVTISENKAPIGRGSIPNHWGGGIYAAASAKIFIANSIVAKNVHNVGSFDTNYSPDCHTLAGTLVSATDNLISQVNSNCPITDLVTGQPPTDLLSGPTTMPFDAKIGQLADNGGINATHILLPGSPAIDRDLTATAFVLYNCKTADQRFRPRPVDGNGDSISRCDIGAVEVAANESANDLDGDGLANQVDLDPGQPSFLFGDLGGGGNTSGQIMTAGSQFLDIEDAGPGQGVTITASAQGGADPAILLVCSDQVSVQISAGQTQTITCVTANAGPDITAECTGQGKATVGLSGSGAAFSGAAVSYLWSAPGVTIQNATQAVATGSFPLGTRTATLQVSRGSDMATDTAQVTVVDTAPPTLNVPPEAFAASCTSVNIGTATASDACGAGAVTITNDAPSSFKAGVFTVTWRATDAAGRQTVKTQKVTVGLGDNVACCPAGSNVIVGTSTNNTLTGTAGVDCILGKGGQDTLRGLGGNDIISGGEGDDVIEGGDGNDVLSGDNGQDTVRGQAGADSMSGGGGDDQCFGGDADDSIFGGTGQDRLFGEVGNDSLFGEDGDDRLEGAAGNDTLDGGNLNDTCLGGTGTNTLLSCEIVL